MSGKPQKGKTPNLVRFAERLAPGSLYLYEDPIWETLEDPPQTLIEVNQAINDFFIRNHIVRLFPEQVADFALKLNIRDQISLYKLSLNDLLGRLNCWARLHLLGLLCREADMAGNTEITELTRSLFDHHVQRVLFSELRSDDADNYYSVFINDFLFSKRQSDVSEGAFREGLEGIVERHCDLLLRWASKQPMILPPYSRTRPIRNVSPCPSQTVGLGWLYAAGNHEVISFSGTSADGPR